MKGLNGKILRVDLTNSQLPVEKPSEAYYGRYLDGRGFIIEKLLTEVPAGIDPLGPEKSLFLP